MKQIVGTRSIKNGGRFNWEILFVAFIFALLIGCTAKVTEAPKPVEQVSTSVETDKDGVYYFLAGNNSDPFYIPGVKGFTDAGKAVGVKTEFVGPMDNNASAQMKTFEELVANPKTKGIFWYPADFNTGEPFVKAAVEKGIPMVIGAADSPFKTRDAFIGYNNTILGGQAGDWVVKLINCKGSVGSIGNNGANVTERIEAFYARITELCPEVEVYERATHDGSAASATATIESYLVAHPDLTLLWFADGAAGQMQQVWKDKQDAGVKTMFLATDMPPATLQAIKDGVFIGSVGQDTYTEEYFGVLLLDALSKGLRVPDTLYLSAIMLDKSNVEQFMEK